MTSDKQDDAALKAYKMRTAAFVSRLKADLNIWIHQHQGDDVFGDPAPAEASSHHFADVTAALLETAVDRQINLLGETDARELVMSAFERRAKALRQRFH